MPKTTRVRCTQVDSTPPAKNNDNNTRSVIHNILANNTISTIAMEEKPKVISSSNVQENFDLVNQKEKIHKDIKFDYFEMMRQDAHRKKKEEVMQNMEVITLDNVNNTEIQQQISMFANCTSTNPAVSNSTTVNSTASPKSNVVESNLLNNIREQSLPPKSTVNVALEFECSRKLPLKTLSYDPSQERLYRVKRY